jgi:hypothetical protein
MGLHCIHDVVPRIDRVSDHSTLIVLENGVQCYCLPSPHAQKVTSRDRRWINFFLGWGAKWFIRESRWRRNQLGV